MPRLGLRSCGLATKVVPGMAVAVLRRADGGGAASGGPVCRLGQPGGAAGCDPHGAQHRALPAPPLRHRADRRLRRSDRADAHAVARPGRRPLRDRSARAERHGRASSLQRARLLRARPRIHHRDRDRRWRQECHRQRHGIRERGPHGRDHRAREQRGLRDRPGRHLHGQRHRPRGPRPERRDPLGLQLERSR